MTTKVERFHHGNPHPGGLHAQLPAEEEKRKAGPVPHVRCPLCERLMLRHGRNFYCATARHGGFSMDATHSPVFGKLPTGEEAMRVALAYREDVTAQFADVQKAAYSEFARLQTTGRRREKASGHWSTEGGDDG